MPRVGSKNASGHFQGVRLILSDKSISGGQRVKTFDAKPRAVKEVLELLREHFQFAELCDLHGLDLEAAARDGSGLHLTGHDGGRRIPIRSDTHLCNFLAGLQNTVLPSLEVQFASSAGGTGSRPGSAVEAARKRAKDRVEELEDVNSKMKASCDRLERRVDDLERLRHRDQEDSQRLLSSTWKQLTDVQQDGVKKLQEQVFRLQKTDEGLKGQVDAVKRHTEQRESVANQYLADVDEQMRSSSTRLDSMRTDVGDLMKKLEEDNVRRNDEFRRHAADAMAVSKQVTLLENSKVNVAAWSEKEQLMSERITAEVARLDDRVDKFSARILAEVEATAVKFEERSASIEKDVADLRSTTSEAMEKCLARLDSFDKRAVESDKLITEFRGLVDNVRSDQGALVKSVKERFVAAKEDVDARERSLKQRMEDNHTNAKASVQKLTDRLEGVVKVERERFSVVDKTIIEAATKVRSDLQSEVAALRGETEQEQSRLDEDLGDLHTKHDVTKQELNHCQTRLSELREWIHSQLVESMTALRAVQVDTQEATQASERMLTVLRDDQVAFRERMAKHIGTLQHDCQNHEDAVGALENQRVQARKDIDAISAEHQSFADDVQGWADDVRLKVERLFRCLEPTIVEWRIEQVMSKKAEMPQPMMLRSQGCNLAGMRGVRLELYPNGTQGAPEGSATVRILVPNGTSIRYRCMLGSLIRGPYEFDSTKGSIWIDVSFAKWEEQVAELHGYIDISFEVLINRNNVDESVGRLVQLTSS